MSESIASFPKKAFVIFEDKPYWYLRLLRKQFRHVSIILVFDDASMVAVNHSWGHTEIAAIHTDWEELVHSGKWIVKRIPITNSRITRSPVFTCTQMVKSLIGIDKWWILTPYQLFKELPSFNNLGPGNGWSR